MDREKRKYLFNNVGLPVFFGTSVGCLLFPAMDSERIDPYFASICGLTLFAVYFYLLFFYRKPIPTQFQFKNILETMATDYASEYVKEAFELSEGTLSKEEQTILADSAKMHFYKGVIAHNKITHEELDLLRKLFLELKQAKNEN